MPQALSLRHWLMLGLALVLVGAVVAAQVLARPAAPAAAVGALYLVDRTTLVALQGEVQLQSVSGAGFEPVVGERALQVGDRVRTGPSGYASIVYFDGSSTSLDPQTEVVVQRFERDPVTGATAIIVQQPLGTTWTLAASTGHPHSGFLLASTAGRFFARGSQFTAEVAPEGIMWVTATEGSVLGRTETGHDVDLASGFSTRLRPGEPPDAPEPATRPSATLHVQITGPVRALLTDARGRSIGHHPDAEPYVSQIPGGRLSQEGSAAVFTVPAPADAYELTLRGLGAGEVTVAVGVLRGAATSAPAAVSLSGQITPNEIQATGFLWKDGQVREARALSPAAGPPGLSAVALLKNPPAALALAPTTTPTAVVAVAATDADADMLAGRAAPPEPQAEDVFSNLEAPLRPEVVAPRVPERPSVVTAPAPAPAVRPVSPPQVVRAPEREPAREPTRPPVVRGLSEAEDVPPTAAPPPPTREVVVVTATPPPPTQPPPTAVPPTQPPPTAVPPTALPTVPPPIPTQPPTVAPTRPAPPRAPAQQQQRPSLAPTATPYVPPGGTTR